jgi:hypothetical protein
MKRFNLLLFIIPVFLFSCDKEKDASTLGFDTTMSMDIPVVVMAPTAIVEKSAAEDIDFSQSQTVSLSDIAEIKNYIEDIESVGIDKVEVVFTNLQEGDEIKTINLSVEGVGTIATISNVTNNTTYTPDIAADKLGELEALLEKGGDITITVSGSVNKVPMNFTVNLGFDLHIEASVE